MVLVTMIVGGILGLVLGVVLYGTRPGNLYSKTRSFYRILDVIVKHHPTDTVHHLPRSHATVDHQSHRHLHRHGPPRSFPMIIMCTMATSRLVEQNLVPVDSGVIEAARAMGASKFTIVRTVLIPEALAPLILAYAFLFIGVLDMSAMAGYIGGGGLGNFAIAYGYQKFDQTVTWTAVIIMIVLVQVVQGVANAIAKHLLKR